MNKLTPRDIEFIIREGEGYQVEFKEAVSDSLGREFVAFANAYGGRVFIGITDIGQKVGVKCSNRLRAQIQDIARNCDPPITVIPDCVENIMVVEVREGTDKPYCCKDGFFLRQGATSQKLRRNEICEMFRRETKIHFDDSFCMNFKYPKDFSIKKFRNYLDLCKLKSNVPVEAALMNMGVAQSQGGRLLFKNAGVLLFAKEPRLFHLQAMIICGRFRGTDKVYIIDRKDFRDDIITNVEEAMKWLTTYIPLKYEITGESLYRKEIPEIPYDAIREAILNSVIHRDYFERGAVTMVEFYDDRIEITNPGGLIPGMTIDDLGFRSAPRNPLLFDLMHRAGLIERMGSGIRRIREMCKDAGLRPPAFESNFFFVIKFLRPSAIVTGEEKQIEVKKVPARIHDIKELRSRVLDHCSKPCSLKEIMVHFNMRDRMHFLKRIIQPLVKEGLLEMSIPEKPKSRFQKYISKRKKSAVREGVDR